MVFSSSNVCMQHHWLVIPEINHVIVNSVTTNAVNLTIDNEIVIDDSPGLVELLLPFESDLPKYARISVDHNGKFKVAIK